MKINLNSEKLLRNLKVDVDMDMIQAMIEKEYIKEREGKSGTNQGESSRKKLNNMNSD